ncbi:electron transport complex protein RnfE [Striga asiatica]|uniref:Electron transport complex protein RnfE n=1 Tax=Striga asiatica TaxID=4170 RepID=A0A5A7QTF9_STRAF|nr:electron transport complex protein RnfE [Striga asiatica]
MPTFQNPHLVEHTQLKRPLAEGNEGTKKCPCLEKAATVSLSAPPSLVKVGQEELVSYLRDIVPAADLNDDSLDLQTRVDLIPLVDQTVTSAGHSIPKLEKGIDVLQPKLIRIPFVITSFPLRRG